MAQLLFFFSFLSLLLSVSSSQPYHFLRRHSSPSLPPSLPPSPPPSLPPSPSPSLPPSSSPSLPPYPSPSPSPSPPPPPSVPPKESVEVTLPPPTSDLPPECTVSLLRHSFAYTYGVPPVSVPYSPPVNCSPPWSHAVLHLSGAVSGNQYDRFAGVWLSGVEILRTTTPEPAESGTFWNVRKDVTKYSSLFQKPNGTLSMMLQNLVNDEFTGVFHINLTLFLYKDENRVGAMGNNLAWGRKLGLGFMDSGVSDEKEEPADLVIPVADDGTNGFWFWIERQSNVGSKNVKIPMNTKRIMLELYVSSHGDDEFWYSNPPTRYLEENNLATNRGNGAFREVFVNIDGNMVASEVPFPVIFTGGINPLFWEPVVAIGAFDLPSYEFDLTPFLGLLLDGKSHSFELGVANAIDFWLVDANLHVWLDKSSSKVEAGAGPWRLPEYKEKWKYDFKELDGSVKVKVERKSYSSGWVSSSDSNLTTSISKKIKLKNSITFQNNGNSKIVEQDVSVKMEVKVASATGELVSQRSLKGSYPLTLLTTTLAMGDESLMTTNLSHALSLREKSSNSYGKVSRSIHNSQESGGSMRVKGHSVLSGESQTQQTLSYQGDPSCFSRSVDASGGQIVRDDSSSACLSLFQKMSLSQTFGRMGLIQAANPSNCMAQPQALVAMIVDLGL